jgi:hypothetical protein
LSAHFGPEKDTCVKLEINDFQPEMVLLVQRW